MRKLIACALSLLVLAVPSAAAVTTTAVKSGQTVSGFTASAPVPQAWVKLCADGTKVAPTAECATVVTGGTAQIITAPTTQNGVFKYDGGLISDTVIGDYVVSDAYRTVEINTSAATPTVLKNATIRNLQCLNVQRGCIRIRDADGVLIQNVKARFKATQTLTMHDLPAGLQFEGNEKNVTVDGFDCAGFQMNMPETDYENGDCINGDAEGTGFKYLNVVANDNTDAGLDSKAYNPIIDNFRAAGNKRNLRLWHGCDCYTLYIGQPLKRGGIGGGAGIWFKGGATGGLAHIRNLVVRFTNTDYPVLLFENAQDVTIDACDIQAPAGTVFMKGPKGKVTLGPGCAIP